MNKKEKVKNYLISSIVNSQIEVGEFIPSERNLMQTLQVSRMTIRNALNDLTSTEWIEPQQGKGYIVIGFGNYDILFAKKKYQIGHTNVSKLSEQEKTLLKKYFNITNESKNFFYVKKYYSTNNKLYIYTINVIPRYFMNYISKQDLLNGYVQALIGHGINLNYQYRSIKINEVTNQYARRLNWKSAHPLIVSKLYSNNHIIEKSIIMLHKTIFEFNKKIIF